MRPYEFIIPILLVPAAQAQWDASRYLYFNTPGSSLSSALPIGNGRVAAAAYGGPIEKITLNENSIWSGPWQDRGNPNASSALWSIREKLIAGNLTSAGQQTLDTMAGNPISPKMYQPAVDMNIDFGHNGTLDNYARVLDTLQGTAMTTYTIGGVNYTREYIASHPAGVIAFRMAASEAGRLNLELALNRTRNVISNAASSSGGVHAITLRSNGGIAFTAEARIVSDGGNVTARGSKFSIKGATTVDIFFDAETAYRYIHTGAWEAEIKKKLDGAVAAGYPVIRAAAIKDVKDILSRVSLSLGSSGSAGMQALPTRLSSFKKDAAADPELVTLYFNYGRHLLLASSRDTGDRSLPANLQGIWNDNYNPPWQSKYTVNINTEMNYWHALTTNLAETHKPLFDLIDLVRSRGNDMAKKMYGCKNGFVLHHNTDLWGDSAPVDKGTPYTVWPMGGAWLSQHLMEHYRFTKDETFLRDRAWPVLKDTADFLYCYLFEYEGHYVTGPTASPENTFAVPANMSIANKTEGVDIATACDNELLWELFTNIVDAANILKVDNEDALKAREYLSKTKAPQIGSKGQILEWRYEYKEAEPEHRHFSHLFGLFPGSQMTPLVDSTLAQASKVSLDERIRAGSGSTGWSRVWAMNLYARLFDGAKVWSNGITFLQTYPLENLWNSGENRWFQIDGNFGFTSAITEMLLQSHELVHILPALPRDAVPEGNVKGLVARGNFVVDIEWSGGVMTKAVVEAKSGGALSLRVEDGSAFMVDGVGYISPLETTVGGKYTITKA